MMQSKRIGLSGKPVAVLRSVRNERLTAGQFQMLSEHEKSLLGRVRFNPPQLGQEGFGSFDVEYRVPLLKAR